MRVRNLIAVVAVLIGAFGVSSAAPASALAANCTDIRVSNVYYTGQWSLDTTVGACTNVSAVRFTNKGYGLTGLDWIQGTGGRFYETSTLTITAFGVQTYYYSGFSVPVFGPGCGQPAILVSPFWGYQIRNSHGTATTSDDTWGSVIQAQGPAQYIC